LEYLDFEDVIPEGSYGAGAMIVWDRGSVRYLEASAEQGLASGKVDFELSGYKLGGRFALVRTSDRKRDARATDPVEWLLFKKTDAHSRSGEEIIEREPFSVLSGLSVEELPERERLAADLERQAAELGAPRGDVEVRELAPMLCAVDGARLDDPERLYELKLDGVRIMADRRGDGVSLRYRHSGVTTSYPDVARAVRALPTERVVLDGEIVAFDESGRPSFQRLAPRIHARRPRDVLRAQDEVAVFYVIFDLLVLGDRDLRTLPLFERKKLLMKLVRGKGQLRALDHLEGDGRPLYELCRERRLEGVVAKRADSPYRHGPRRSDDWVKIKCERDDEFVVVGWVAGKGGRRDLGALVVASFVGERLVYRGKVGSGLDERSITSLLERLQALETQRLAAEGAVPRDVARGHFVRPELVVSVRFSDFTDEGNLRAPVFRGLREDIDPKSCRAAPSDERLAHELETMEEEPEPDEPKLPSKQRVPLSNRSKIFWPEEGYTKGDLIDYYAAVAPAMLPFLQGRPIVLVRYPDGIEGKNFYQWRAPAGTPSWMRTLELYDEDKQRERGTDKRVFLIDDVDGLLFIANLGAIVVHALASREASPEDCDFLTVDFDIGEQPFRHAVTLALSLRELLDELGLSGFPKTSGQKGLHVLVPLGPGVGFETAKLLVELLGRLLVARHADIATMERRVEKRGGKVYVDTVQTGRSRTIVAPYSVRAHRGATVSTPLSWDEVHAALDPAGFTMVTVPARLADLGEPMADLLEARPDVPEAVAAIERKVRGSQ
jgi:bifunctional non-homologous end joining protein LigD